LVNFYLPCVHPIFRFETSSLKPVSSPGVIALKREEKWLKPKKLILVVLGEAAKNDTFHLKNFG
jgi:hypothetical protein